MSEENDWRNEQFQPTELACWVCGFKDKTGIEARMGYVVCEEHKAISVHDVLEGEHAPWRTIDGNKDTQ